MMTHISRRWLLAGLCLLTAPLSVFAQDYTIAVTPAGATSVTAGESTPLTVSLTNISGGDLVDVPIIIVPGLPTGVTWGNATTGAGVVWNSTFQTLTIDSLPAGATDLQVLAVDFDIDPSVPAGASFFVEVVSNQAPPIANSVTSGTITVAREYDLALSVVDAPDPVLAGSGTGNLTHTFTLTRAGLSDAGSVAVVLNPIVTPAGVAIDSAVPSVGSFLGDTWTVGDVPASANGTVGTLTVTLTVDYTAASCTDCISATGTVAAADGGTDTDSGNDSAVDPTSIETASDINSIFATSIDFSDDSTDPVTATLTCNSGLPLKQSFDISEGSGVSFTVTQLPFLTPGTVCEVTLDGLDSAYTLSPASCTFATGDFANDGVNTCAFAAAAEAATYTVEKVWVLPAAGAEEASYDVDVTITCESDILSVDGSAYMGGMTATATIGDGESVEVMVDTAAGATSCSATETVPQSGVESEASEDCTDAALPAGGDATCTFTNTVFFEGIPTLSQYGLVIMALLMLGVGFVGVRRFV